MKKIIVYLKADYSESDVIYVSGDLSKYEITKELDKNFNKWYYYDIE